MGASNYQLGNNSSINTVDFGVHRNVAFVRVGGGTNGVVGSVGYSSDLSGGGCTIA